MTRTVAGHVVFLVLAASLTVAAAVTWEEQAAGPQFRIHPTSGETQVGFYVVMAYAPIPDGVHLDIEWSVGVVRGSHVEELVSEHLPRPANRGRYLTISALSPFVTIAPGETYAATLVLGDLRNQLSYRREYRYVAPVVVPTGIGLSASAAADDEAVDWSSVSDEEVATLAGYHARLASGFAETASGIDPPAFFSAVAGAAGFPAWVIVLAPLGGTATITAGGLSLTAASRILFVYVVPSAGAAGAVLEQLAEVGTGFLGRGLTRQGGSDPPATAFVSDDAWAALEGAVEEHVRRGG